VPDCVEAALSWALDFWSLDSDFFLEPNKEEKRPDSFLLTGFCDGGGGEGVGAVAAIIGLAASTTGAGNGLRSIDSTGPGNSDRNSVCFEGSGKVGDRFGFSLFRGFSFGCSSSDDEVNSRLHGPFLDWGCTAGSEGGGGGKGAWREEGWGGKVGETSRGVIDSTGDFGLGSGGVGESGETGDFFGGRSGKISLGGRSLGGSSMGGNSLTGERRGGCNASGASTVKRRNGGRRNCRG